MSYVTVMVLAKIQKEKKNKNIFSSSREKHSSDFNYSDNNNLKEIFVKCEFMKENL